MVEKKAWPLQKICATAKKISQFAVLA